MKKNSKPCCGNCRFWKPYIQLQKIVHFGRCFRFPPVPMANPDPSEKIEMPLLSLFPEVPDHAWCGEWQAKKGK
jgi:hypothetical protein